jgi:hypothetical protein
MAAVRSLLPSWTTLPCVPTHFHRSELLHFRSIVVLVRAREHHDQY